MQLHTHLPINENQGRRVGRGGKRGTTSGRGQKGQKSRAGRKMRPAIRDLIARIPKRRGFSNKQKSDDPLTLSLKRITSITGVIDIERLRKEHLIGQKYRGKVKIIGNSEVTSVIQTRGLQVSGGAKKRIEEAGGNVG